MNSGAFGENFPYSNFHDLNMDWIIKIAKDFLDQYTHIQQIIEQGEADITELSESSLTASEEKKEALESALQDWYDTHSEDIATELANALADLNQWYSTHEHYLDQTLTDNISTFNTRAQEIGQTVIASIPNDYSETSATAEEALKRLKDLKLNLLIDAEWTENKAIEVYTGTVFDTVLYKMLIVNLPCNHGKLTYRTIASSPKTNICFYDASDNYITDYFSTAVPATWMERTVDIPANAVKVGINCYTEFDSETDCKLFIDVSETIDNIYESMNANIIKYIPISTSTGDKICWFL